MRAPSSLASAGKGAEWAPQFVEFSSNLLGTVAEGVIDYVNPAGVRMLGYETDEDITGRPLAEFVHPDYRDLLDDGLSILAEEGLPLPLRLIRSGGALIDAEFVVRPMNRGNRAAYMIEARDITRFKQSAEAVRAREQKLQGILKTAAEAIITIERDGTIESFNPAAERMFGHRTNEILAKPVTSLLVDPAPEPGEDPCAHVRGRLIGTNREGLGKRKDGEEFPIEFSVAELRHGSQLLFIGIIRDIGERRRAEERIRHLAHHDPLTGLPNRHLFNDRLAMALSRARRGGAKLALMYVDLDRFKPINDTLGHEAGDAVLKAVAERLNQALRKVDTVARVGGDEFVVIAESITSVEDAGVVARKILESLREPIAFRTHECRIGCSIGISLFPEHGDDPDTLCRTADSAMYAVKAAGRNDFRIFRPGCDE
ncbi:MAG: sensor domain-containing diguanylate cyclase [Alphaproteobacteria bacterium]|nr:sensor domain-containing diguanylate cyclase [Alphaproteobacteria bacterium]